MNIATGLPVPLISLLRPHVCCRNVLSLREGTATRNMEGFGVRKHAVPLVGGLTRALGHLSQCKLGEVFLWSLDQAVSNTTTTTTKHAYSVKVIWHFLVEGASVYESIVELVRQT